MDYAVVVKGLSKQFYRYHADRPWTLHETLVKGLRRLQPAERFWALRRCELQRCAGSRGWSDRLQRIRQITLLRLIGGVGRPTRDT